MQTFTMQFPATSTVTVGHGGVITITPFGYVSTTRVDVCSVNTAPVSTPPVDDLVVGDDKDIFTVKTMPAPHEDGYIVSAKLREQLEKTTPATLQPTEPVHADDGFRQLPNVRVHGGNVSLARAIAGGAGGTMGLHVDAPPVSPAPVKVVVKPLPVDLLLEWIGENTATSISTELSANELRYKFGRGFEILEDVWVITRDGVVGWSPTPTETPSSKRIAVVYRDCVEGITYVAPYSNVLRSNAKYLADALRGGVYSIKTLSKILQTTGRHTGCPSHCAVPKHLTEDIKYIPLCDYLASLDIADVDSTTYSPMTIKTVVGRKYDGVEGLSILTSEGVCPWMDVTPKDVTRIALMYMCAESKTMYVAHYLSSTRGQYSDCVGVIESAVQSAAT